MKPVIGHLNDFQRDPISFMLTSANEHGDILMFKVLNKRIYFINHPDLIKHVLHTNYKNYVKSPGYKPLRLLGGMGIFTNDGEEWLRRRRFYQPAFKASNIESYTGAVLTNTEKLLETWEKEGFDRVNISMEMSKVTMAVISETLFSTRIDFGSDLWNNITYAFDWVGERALRNPFVVPANWPTKKNKRFHKAVAGLDELIYRIIDEKRNSKEKVKDLLSRFMNPEEKNLKPLNDVELRDEVMTIFLAGHETSANVLSWTLFEVGRRPDIQQKLMEEVKLFDERQITYNDLHSLVYTTQVLNETMRLYPPVWHLGRQSIKEDRLGDYELPAGGYVRMSPLAIHRRKEYWDEPQVYNPDRFHPSKFESIQQYAFMPFGGGPRLCAGRNFAMMEMVLMLAILVRSFKFEFEGEIPEMQPGGTLRAKKDIHLNISPRK